MDYKQLNDKLKNLSTLRHSSKLVHKEVVNEVDGDYGSQGEQGLTYEVYDIGLEAGMFVKLSITTDSYGDNESISGLEFVQGKEKKVTVYEF